jgi:hypothetical protein
VKKWFKIQNIFLASKAVFLSQCAVTHKCAVESQNVIESMQKQLYIYPFGLFFTIRCAAKLVFKISVPQAQKS